MRAVIAILAILTILGCDSSGDDELLEAKNQLSNQILVEMDIAQIPSISAAIIRDGQSEWQLTEKIDNLTVLNSPDEQSIYMLGHASRLFLSVAVLQLVDQSMITLDDDINDHIDVEIVNRFFPNEPITIKQLLLNSSSISPYALYSPELGFFHDEKYDTTLMVETVVRDYISPQGAKHDSSMWLARKPGNVVESSPLGAMVLAYLVEQKSGLLFSNYCKHNIFQPLGMSNTGYILSELPDEDQLEIYTTDPPIGSGGLYNSTLFPAYAAKSSLHDLTLFVTAILNEGIGENGERILGNKSANEMIRIRDKTTELPFDSSTGFLWQAPFDGPWIGQWGSTFGATTIVEINPELKLGLIVLSNRGARNTILPGNPIYEIVHDFAEAHY